MYRLPFVVLGKRVVKSYSLGKTEHSQNVLTRGKLTEFLSYILFYICLFCLYVCLRSTCVQCPRRPEEGTASPEIVVTDSGKSLCRWYSESNAGPLEEQLVPLTTQPPLQSLVAHIYLNVFESFSNKTKIYSIKKVPYFLMALQLSPTPCLGLAIAQGVVCKHSQNT